MRKVILFIFCITTVACHSNTDQNTKEDSAKNSYGTTVSSGQFDMATLSLNENLETLTNSLGIQAETNDDNDVTLPGYEVVKSTSLKVLRFENFDGFSPTNTELKAAKKLYAGEWVNKKAKRHLTISFDTEDYATINDWHDKWGKENASIDAYNAFVKQGKLVMPEDNTDLRSPYCEIIKKGDLLLYRCREMNTKNKKFVDNMWFVREKN